MDYKLHDVDPAGSFDLLKKEAVRLEWQLRVEAAERVEREASLPAILKDPSWGNPHT
jgi:hypothetical protein